MPVPQPNPHLSNPQPWSAPVAPAPIRATVPIPGSKSQTNRALVLAALADGPSMITAGLEARDTELMRTALRTLGVRIEESQPGEIQPGEIQPEQTQSEQTQSGGEAVWRVTPPEMFAGGGTIDCGLAGTVMRFVPALAALADGPVTFDGDEQAYDRPMAGILEPLTVLGAAVDNTSRLPFTVTGQPELTGGVVEVDASASSQFVSALLLIGSRLTEGIQIHHSGDPIPSHPHIAMTVAMLRERGVQVDDNTPHRWSVTPGPIKTLDVVIEPDLSNAAPFLAAAAITGGTVTIPRWPAETHQPGDLIRGILETFGAEVALIDAGLVVTGTDYLHDVDLDLADASELTPVVAAIAALAEHTSHLHGIAHIRGHETDRLAALETELNRLGCHVTQTHDGLTIHSRLLHDSEWRTYADHRMAQAGALLGLVIEGITLDDISCTAKTMPGFADLWQQMIDDSELQDPADQHTLDRQA